jgi:thiamine biosynthesis lipoprotein
MPGNILYVKINVQKSKLQIEIKKLSYLLPALAVVIILFFLMQRAANNILVRSDSASIITMDTVAKVAAVAKDRQTAEKAANEALKKIRQLESLMNRYDPNSQLSKVNQLAADESVKIDRELFDILRQSIEYSEKTKGAFDITVGPLVDLWKKCAEANSMPTQEQLALVKKQIGCDKLLLDSNEFSVRFAAEGMSLDLGAIAKGFAANLAVAEMKKAGAVGGLVDLGGQISCFGTTERKGKWMIGIQNPAKLEDNQAVIKLSLNNSAVATSGDYRRFYKIGDKHFSHIFNPVTEKSADELTSVTIISANGIEADALATAVSVLGVQKGLELIEKTENTEAIIIEAAGSRIIKSSGAEKYLVE